MDTVSPIFIETCFNWNASLMVVISWSLNGLHCIFSFFFDSQLTLLAAFQLVFLINVEQYSFYWTAYPVTMSSFDCRRSVWSVPTKPTLNWYQIVITSNGLCLSRNLDCTCIHVSKIRQFSNRKLQHVFQGQFPAKILLLIQWVSHTTQPRSNTYLHRIHCNIINAVAIRTLS